MFILLVLLTYFLLCKTGNIKGKILKPEEISENRSISSKEIQAIAFSVLGLWVLTTSLPNLVQILTRYVVIKANSELAIDDKYTIYSISHSASLVLKIGLGLYLFLGSNGLVNLWHRFQKTKGMSSN